MNTIEKIKSDLLVAIKNNSCSKDILRQLKSVLDNILIEKKSLSEIDTISAIRKQIKQREEAIVLFIQGNRMDLVAVEQKEIDILKTYLPPDVDISKLKDIVSDAIAKLNPERKDMGKIITSVKEKTGGSIDGKLIADEVKRQFNLLFR